MGHNWAMTEPSDGELETELLRLTRSRQGGRQLAAKVTAIRTLLRRRQAERGAAEREARALLRRDEQQDEELIWPSETPDELAPTGYWPYDDGDPDGWEALDAVDTQRQRDAWRTRAEGRPPWRRDAIEDKAIEG